MSIPVGGCLDGNGRVKLLCAPRGSLYVPLCVTVVTGALHVEPRPPSRRG